MPVAHIGDMPRHLLSYKEWLPLSIKVEETKCGDLFFVKNKSHPKPLSHVAMFIHRDLLFHCSSDERTAVVQNYMHFTDHYEQRLPFPLTNFIS